MVGSVISKSNQWFKNDYNIANKIKTGNIRVNHITRVPIFEGDRFGVIDEISISDSDNNGNNYILKEGDIITFLPLKNASLHLSTSFRLNLDL